MITKTTDSLKVRACIHMRMALLSLLFFASLFFSNLANAQFFQPIPTLDQFHIPTISKMYKSELGGVWLQDINGNLRYFSGQHLVPPQLSFLDKSYQNLAYDNGHLWFSAERKLLRRTESSNEIVQIDEFDYLIEAIGSTQRGIWASSEKSLKLHSNTNTLLLELELSELQHIVASAKSISINDVKPYQSSWIIATNLGAYKVTDGQIELIKSSRGQSVDKILIVPEIDTMVLGTREGVLIYKNLTNELSLTHRASTEHVLALEYFDNNIWIGTERGLVKIVIDDNGYQTEKKQYLNHIYDDYSLPGNKVYSILNAQNGTLWISTDMGVRLVNKVEKNAFARADSFSTTQGIYDTKLNSIITESSGATWFSTELGLFKVTSLYNDNDEFSPNYEQHLAQPIRNLASIDDQIWYTNDKGLYFYNQTDRTSKLLVPSSRLQGYTLDHLTADDNSYLWFSTELGLYRYSYKKDEMQSFRLDWVVDDYKPAHITSLNTATNGRLLIGTDHGAYNYSNGRIQLNNATTVLGKINDSLATQQDDIWYLGSNGVRYSKSIKPRLLDVGLRYASARPLCAIDNNFGVWVVTSSGVELYSHAGKWLKHFGGRIGLIEGEFIDQLCTLMADEKTIMIGSRLGAVFLDTEKLSSSQLTDYTHISTTIWDIKQRVIYNATNTNDPLKYQSNALLLFSDGLGLEKLELDYSIQQAETKLWLPLINNQLTVSRFDSDDFAVDYRPTGIEAHGNLKYVSISVSPPWYLNKPWVILLTISLSLLFLIVFYLLYLRYKQQKLVLENELQLSQSQLSHQSRVLLSNSLHQRKQSQVKMKIISRLASSIKKQIMYDNVSDEEQSKSAIAQRKDMIDAIESISGHIGSSKTRAIVIEIDWLLMAIYESWQRDFKESECSLQMYGLNQLVRVKVHATHLDSVINTLFAHMLKNVAQGTEVSLSVEKSESKISIQIAADTLPFDDKDSDDPTGNVSNGSKINEHIDASFSAARHQINALKGEFMVTYQNNLIKFRIDLPALSTQSKYLNSNPDEQPDKAPNEQEKWLIKVLDLMESNYSDPDFSTSSAAKALFMSDRSLQRKFKSQTESTFKEYLIRLRLEKSAHLLMEGESVADVAYANGFNDPSYFSQRFKTHFGLSPSKFIESSEAS